MSAFQECDRDYFFGRERFVEQLVNAIQRQPLVAVIGPSGSGKSSVVRAGLFPQLLEQGNWLIVWFRPGYPNNNPFRNLASVLVPLLETRMSENKRLEEIKNQSEKLSKGEIDLSDAIARILQKNSHKRLLLFVDQFEELYTLCRDTQEQQRFVDALLATVQSAPRAVTLVLTLRADFYSYVLNYPAFGEALERHTPLSLRAMNREEMLSCIERPAAKMGVKLEEGLTQRILDDVKQEPGNLPLLEFALTQLWDKQSRGLLTHQAYSEIGGVAKALALHAEAVYTKLTKEEQKQAQRLFVQLVRPGEGTEDTRRLATPAEVGNWELVTRLADARLVVTGRDEQTEEETVEVVHEALIREWGQLRGWMESDRTFRTWQERLRATMRQWESTDKDEGALLRGVPLAEAEDWQQKRLDELSQVELEFIQHSLELRDYLSKQEEERLQRELKQQTTKTRLAIATASLTIVSLAVGVFAWQQLQQQKLLTVFQDVVLGEPRTELLSILPDLLTDADKLRKVGNVERALAFYRSILNFTDRLQTKISENSQEFQNHESLKRRIKSIAKQSEESLVKTIRTQRIPQLVTDLKASQFGKIKDEYKLTDFQEKYTKGALRTTYMILMRELGAKADLNDDGKLNNKEEAERMPCDTLKEVEKLWRQFTQNRCGWYGLDSAYTNPACSELNGQSLAKVMFVHPYDFAINRINSCQVSTKPIDPDH